MENSAFNGTKHDSFWFIYRIQHVVYSLEVTFLLGGATSNIIDVFGIIFYIDPLYSITYKKNPHVAGNGDF